MTYKLLAITTSMMLSSFSYADADKSLGNFFDDLGMQSNVTRPTAYQGQAANYYSAGSLVARNRSVNLDIANLQVPDIKAGCGGIDMFFGGFSHINATALMKFGKAVIAQAPAFFADLALQTWAPQIKEIRDQLQAIADKFLNQSINSCETAQAGVSALAGFAGVGSQKFICETMGTQDNTFSDWVQAQHECGRSSRTEGLLNKARKNPAYQDMVKRHRNIMWEELKKIGYLKYDVELRQFFMSLSGTVIYDDKGVTKFYPSLFHHNVNAVESLLKGGRLDGYECTDTEACVNVIKGEETIRASQSLTAKIDRILNKIVTNLSHDQPLGSSEQSFLEYANLPVLKLILNDLYEGKKSDTHQYANLMAVELLQIYLSKILRHVEHALVNTHNDAHDIKRIQDSITLSQIYLDELSQKSKSKTMLRQALIHRGRESDVRREGQVSRMLQRIELGR